MKTSLKKAISSIFLVVLSISFYAQSNSTYTIDKVNSVIHWKGYKPMGSQSGTIKFLNGNVDIEKEKVIGGEFIANMNSIIEDKRRSKLENHLKSADFFDVEKFPTAIFKINSVVTKNEKTYLEGDLTIKNITKQIVVPADISINPKSIKITTETIKVNRADFNVKYKSNSFFDNLKNEFIHDDFDLQVTIVANR